MKIEIRAQVGRSVELCPVGELDLASAPDLRSVIDALAERNVDTLIVQADALTFMDAAGLTPLIEATAVMTVIVCDPSRPVRRLLELTGMDAWISDTAGTEG